MINAGSGESFLMLLGYMITMIPLSLVDDPDWKVKQCCLPLIAVATEVIIGMENLWKSGPSTGLHNYPDFGQYPRTTSRHFVQLHFMPGQMRNIGMKITEMCLEMCSCHAINFSTLHHFYGARSVHFLRTGMRKVKKKINVRQK